MRAPYRHVALVVFVILTAVGQARAGDFQVAPTHLELARRGATTELTISNRGQVATRFEATVFIWHQSELGAMELEPTTDVIVYPTLFTIEPGKQRAIRLATAARSGAIEQTYRIFVEELPAPRTRPIAGGPATIAVRARIGVPIYVEPTKPLVSGAVTGELRAGVVRLALENRGNVHVKVSAVRLVGTDRAGRVVIDLAQPSWYLLAGGTRRHELALDRVACRSVTHLAVEAVTDRGPWRATIATPADGCTSSP